MACRIIGRPVHPNGKSAATLELARRWVDHCAETHGQCKRSEITDLPLPTRVIDIGVAEGSTLCLFVTGRIPGKWAALSHRWGRTTWGNRIDPEEKVSGSDNGNLSELQRGISGDFLSPTFSDAITVTRAIRLQYLWIDGLCILQDSVEDWSVKSGHITSVYKDTHITIAAGSSADGSNGILTERI